MSPISRRYAVAGLILLLSVAACDYFLPGALPEFLRGTWYGLAIGCLLAAALKSRLPDACDTSTPALRRRYLREFVPPMAAYLVLVLLSVWLLRHVDGRLLRALVALMPVPAIALAMRAIVRYIRDADELQRRIELEAVSIATALVSLGYLTAGFLQSARVIQVPASAAMIWVFPLVCVIYAVVKVAVTRRYA